LAIPIAISRRADLDIIVINRPEMAPFGAGEQATIPIAAAIGNAIFDAPARAGSSAKDIKMGHWSGGVMEYWGRIPITPTLRHSRAQRVGASSSERNVAGEPLWAAG
jgi:CO/xanthine dehydrogenase Mo-binding subunit